MLPRCAVFAIRKPASATTANLLFDRSLSSTVTRGFQLRRTHLVLTYRAKFDEAENEFKQAVALDPMSFDAAYHYGRILVTARRLERAAEMFETAAALRPDDYQAPALAMNMYTGAKNKDASLNAAARSVEAAERALAINPGDLAPSVSER